MKALRKTLAAVLAGAVLMLAACHSENKNLIGGDNSSEDTSAKVIMFNMWEPWCGPCRSELPDLQKLYQKYKSEGLMIVGVYSDTDGLKDIVKESKVKYPMILSCEAFDQFQTGYVPTTVFIDGSGKILSDEPIVGSNSYEEWEKIILSYLK